MRSARNSWLNDKGIALIAALGITLMLTLLALALAYRSGLFVATSRGMLVKSQDLYATEIALNEMRHYLWENDCVPPYWLCLGGVMNTNNTASPDYNRYLDYSAAVRGLFSQHLKFTAGTVQITYGNTGDLVYETATSPAVEFDRYSHQVFAKATSVPKTINILSTSERPGQESRTIVEAALIFDDSSYGYEQKNQSLSKGGFAGETIDTDGQANARVRTSF